MMMASNCSDCSRVFTSAPFCGDNSSARAREDVAFKFEDSLFLFNQQHSAGDRSLMLPRAGFGSSASRGYSRRCRNPHFDGCAAFGIVVRRNVSAVFLHNSVADAESQPGSLTHALGGIEGIEYALGIFDSGSIVAEGSAHVPIRGSDANLELPAAPGFQNRVHRVVDDVQKHLLDLVRVGYN